MEENKQLSVRPEDDKDFKGLELKFARWFHQNEDENDIHIVKEQIHFHNKPPEKRVRLIYGFKRPFYITKEHYRNHEQKKESEDFSKLKPYMSTEKDLANNVGMALGKQGYRKNSMRDHRYSPFIYGTDIPSTSYLKEAYLKKWDILTNYEVAALDIEARTTNGEILINTVAKIGYIHTVVNEDIVKGIKDPVDVIRKRMDELLPDSKIKTDLKDIKIEIGKEIDVCLKPIQTAHKWRPDWLAIWNIEYDITQLEKCMLRYNVEPKDVWSDKIVPERYRFYDFKLGTRFTKTNGDVMKPKTPAEQWHVLKIPASFHPIDAMQMYKQIRINGSDAAGGYGLDNILRLEINHTKLKIDDPIANKLTGADWHDYMVEHRPIDYIVYNMWDVLGMLELDNKTLDLKLIAPMFADITPFELFNSGPKKLVGQFYKWLGENNRALGMAPQESEYENLIGRRGFTVNLKPYMKKPGEKSHINHPLLENGIVLDVKDLDVTSAYPTVTLVTNLSRDTIRKEWKKAEGIDNEVAKYENMQLMFGKVNSIRYVRNMLSGPTLDDIDNSVKELKEEQKLPMPLAA